MTRSRMRVLNFIVQFHRLHGFMPTFQDIGSGLNLSSLATVHKHIVKLVEEGHLAKNRVGARHHYELVAHEAIVHRQDQQRTATFESALREIADGLTTDMVSRHIARVALGMEK